MENRSASARETPGSSPRASRRQRRLAYGAGLALALSCAPAAAHVAVSAAARERCFTRVEDVPVRACGLVLGTVPRVQGRENLYFRARMRAAAELVHAGKVRFLIVSGDNSRADYDEPSAMKSALIDLGVPASRIYCDYAGLRTLDSVVRAKEVFGQTSLTVVSQRYHNERALYLAEHSGLENCVALDAPGVGGGSMLRQRARELAARCAAMLDVNLLRTRPRFLGEPIAVGEHAPPRDANPLP